MKLWFLCFALLPVAIGAPPANEDYHDILGTGKREWRLAFRGTAGAGKSIYDAYKSRQSGAVPAGCKTVNWQAACNAHYRNDAVVDNWARIDQVLVGIIQGGVMVKSVTYDGAKSTPMNWMSKDRFVESCWDDLSDKNTNFNSIDGHSQINRRFFINHKYGGCPNDVGWLSIVDTPKPPCPWEKVVPKGQPFKFPLIKFSPGPTRINWNTGYPMNADAIAVFVKYTPQNGSPSEFANLLGEPGNKKEWRLAFRGTAGVKTSVYDAYVDGTGVPNHVDPGCKTTNWGAQCRSHYRNDDVLDNWKNIKEVTLGIVQNGALVKTAIFNGVGSDNMNWLSKDRLISSCWGDLKKKSSNFFSLGGHARLKRRFFISHKYGGCPNDMLWFLVVDRVDPPCKWERRPSWPSFLYAAGPRVQNANDAVQIRSADAMVVLVKYGQ